MSAPRGRRVRSINAMIKDGMEEFPISMCNAGTVLRMVTNVGCIPTIVAAKADWVHAYEHIPICLGDTGLQFVSWGGKLFVDLSLVFGASSSPSVFDQVAAIVLYFSVILAGVSSGNTGHQLDDAFFIGLENEASSWFAAYQQVCARVGIKLADLSKPDKMMPPSKQITLLGLEYDLGSWLWRMPLDKSNKLQVDLHSLFMLDQAPMQLVTCVVGKINHYAGVLGGRLGKFERSFLIYLTDDQEEREFIYIDGNIRSQITWWLRGSWLGENWSPLVDMRVSMPVFATRVFTDTAGGSPGSLSGMGGVVFGHDLVYFQHVWPDFIQTNSLWQGVHFASKLTHLELAALLGGILAAPRGFPMGVLF